MSTSAPTLVTYLRSLEAVRDRSQQVYNLAVRGEFDHWDWHEEKLADVVAYCTKSIEVCSSEAHLMVLTMLMMMQRDFGKDYTRVS